MNNHILVKTWFHLSYKINKSVYQIDMKFDRQLQPATETSWVSRMVVKQFQDGERPPFWKSIYCHISAKKSSDFDEILYTAADFELDERHMIKKKLHWTDSECDRTYILFNDAAHQTWRLRRCTTQPTVVLTVPCSTDAKAACSWAEGHRRRRDVVSTEHRAAEYDDCCDPLRKRSRESQRQRVGSSRVMATVNRWTDVAPHRQCWLQWLDTGPVVWWSDCW